MMMMMNFRILIATIAASSTTLLAEACSDLLITGVIDGPLSGGVPKAIELYAATDIPNLSVCKSFGWPYSPYVTYAQPAVYPNHFSFARAWSTQSTHILHCHSIHYVRPIFHRRAWVR